MFPMVYLMIYYIIQANGGHVKPLCHTLCHSRSRPELNLWTFALFVYHLNTAHFAHSAKYMMVPGYDIYLPIFHDLSWKHAFEISIIATLIFSLWNHINNDKALNLTSMNINEYQYFSIVIF